jgi:DNA polymerase IIIc chi subunit
MTQCIIYQTEDDDMFLKHVSRIIETIFKTKNRLLVWTSSVNELDKTLWTFKSKEFIPHGTNIDRFKEIQPILISNELLNYNRANVLIIINNYLPVINFNSFSYIVFINNQEKLSISQMETYKINKYYKMLSDSNKWELVTNI